MYSFLKVSVSDELESSLKLISHGTVDLKLLNTCCVGSIRHLEDIKKVSNFKFGCSSTVGIHRGKAFKQLTTDFTLFTTKFYHNIDFCEEKEFDPRDPYKL